MKSTKQSVAERIWLHYFNRCLFEKGLITENERNRMAVKINNRQSGAKRAAQ